MRRATRRSRSAKWLATHERTARAGGALFSPRVRPALCRADPVARRAPSRPRRGRRSSRARAGPGNLVSARRATRPGRLALPHPPQPGHRRAAAGANPRPGIAAPGRKRRAGLVAARSAFRRRDRRRTAAPALRLQLPTQTRFYYPDASVVCRPNPPEDSFQDNPAALFEVLSQSTRRIDEGEKKDAYLTIPSLRVYALVEQESPTVIVFRRTEA